jgi:hypothetical protein
MHLVTRILLPLLFVVVLVAPTVATERCQSILMTVSATFPNDPGFEGYYRYNVFGSWEVWPRALSHLDVFLMLQQCPLVCEPGIVAFGDTAGISTGSTPGESPCYPVYYLGEYLCHGDNSLPPELQYTAVKFEPFEDQACQPSTVEMGSWRFYSWLPPGPSMTHVDAVAVKHGQYVCTGDITGQLPICAVATGTASWGRLKNLYR